MLFVTFASQSGKSGGYVDLYTEAGVFVRRVAQGWPLDQPWGLAAAPTNFGMLSNTLLISNKVARRSTISGFNIFTGKLVGTIKDVSGSNIDIDQLWGIDFGGGTAANGNLNELFFTAGPNGYTAGTFGKITVAQ